MNTPEQAGNSLHQTQQTTRVTRLSEAIRVISGRRGLHAILPFTYGWADYPTRGIKDKSIRPLRFTDGPKGVNLGHSTCFPVAIARGASWDAALEYRIGQAMALEAAAHGANTLGSVCINLIRHPGWGRAQESFGADPIHVGAMGVALMKGIQSKGVLSVIKHFACNSIENSRFKVSVTIDKRSLHEMYLPHFKQVVDAGAAGVMSAYNQVNGNYCGHHSYLLKDVLKTRWQFRGFVMSDFVLGIRNTRALAQGVDLEMPQRFWFSNFFIKRAIKRGIFTENDVIKAANRVVEQLIRFELPGQNSNLKNSKKIVACAEHQQLALEAAQKACVLLKNENQVLPFRNEIADAHSHMSQSAQKTNIVVVGPLAKRANMGSPGSVTVTPPSHSTLLEGLVLAYPDANICYDSGKNIKHLRQIVAHCDLVIVTAGLFGHEEGEYFPFVTGGDRVKLELPRRQIETITAVAQTNPRHVVVLYAGSSIALGDWVDSINGLILAWYPGMKGGQAIAQIIAGEINPSGHLPMSLPKNTADLPAFDPKASHVTYDLYHDYRWFHAKRIAPAFPFGYGLSYTKFSLTNLSISEFNKENRINISFFVVNTGTCKGSTVAQVYVSKPPCVGDGVVHPEFELKNFSRIELQAGEQRQIELTLESKHFAWFNPTIDQWQIDAGEYGIHIGQYFKQFELNGSCVFKKQTIFFNV